MYDKIYKDIYKGLKFIMPEGLIDVNGRTVIGKSCKFEILHYQKDIIPPAFHH